MGLKQAVLVFKEELKESKIVARVSTSPSFEKRIEALEEIVSLTEKVLEIKGSGILPEKRPIDPKKNPVPYGHTDEYFNAGHNQCIDEMALRMARGLPTVEALTLIEDFLKYTIESHPHSVEFKRQLKSGELEKRLKIIGEPFDPTGRVKLVLRATTTLKLFEERVKGAR